MPVLRSTPHHLTPSSSYPNLKGTSVELDPASQVEATTAMAGRGQVAVGW